MSSAGPKVTPRALIAPHRCLFVPYDCVLCALCFALITHKRNPPACADTLRIKYNGNGVIYPTRTIQREINAFTVRVDDGNLNGEN